MYQSNYRRSFFIQFLILFSKLILLTSQTCWNWSPSFWSVLDKRCVSVVFRDLTNRSFWTSCTWFFCACFVWFVTKFLLNSIIWNLGWNLVVFALGNLNIWPFQFFTMFILGFLFLILFCRCIAIRFWAFQTCNFWSISIVAFSGYFPNSFLGLPLMLF